MTAEKLYGILEFLDSLDTKLALQTTLEAIRDHLNNLVNSPATPQYQNSLASALSTLEAARPQLRETITPSIAVAIKSMGGEEFFVPEVVDKVKEAVQKNAMTPAVARDFVKALVENRSKFLDTVSSAKDSLKKLHAEGSRLEAGSADMAFLIPRDIFKNELGSFGEELKFINRLVEHFSEAATGTAEPAQLEGLSSSVPTIALIAALPVLSLLGDVINKFLEAWERIERIRKVRSDLSDLGVPGPALDHINEQITTTVEKVVEESTQLVLAKYPGENGRKAELENGIRTDVFRLFGQIERGLSVEIRVNSQPKQDQGQEDKEALKRLSEVSKTLAFPEPAKQPMLLKAGEVLDGDNDVVIVSQWKKTSKEEPARATD
jgi:hypothetical protein